MRVLNFTKFIRVHASYLEDPSSYDIHFKNNFFQDFRSDKFFFFLSLIIKKAKRNAFFLDTFYINIEIFLFRSFVAIDFY